MIACRHYVSLELSNWFVMCVQITFIHYYISVYDCTAFTTTVCHFKKNFYNKYTPTNAYSE